MSGVRGVFQADKGPESNERNFNMERSLAITLFGNSVFAVCKGSTNLAHGIIKAYIWQAKLESLSAEQDAKLFPYVPKERIHIRAEPRKVTGDSTL